MQTKPVILARTNYDLITLFKSAKQALGYNINRTIDAKAIQKDVQKFYYAMSEFNNENYEYLPAMEGRVLELYTYVIGLVVDDDVYRELLHYREIQLLGPSTIKRGYVYCVASGTIKQWRDLVIDGSNKESSYGLREALTSIYALFATEGLANIWSNYSKFNHENTMILVPQK